MPVIVVANPKGGAGKTTLSTNVAAWLATSGRAVMLGDVDRQQSSRLWLRHRPDTLARIQAWEAVADGIVKPPKGTTHVVLDTPAGLHGKRLDEVMKIADKMLIPLQPSLFDIQATHAFVELLREHKRRDRVEIGVVGMRTREGTIATEQLHDFIAAAKLPLVGALRDTQNYVQLAAHGLTLWDVPSARFERDRSQWQPIVEWLERPGSSSSG